MSQHSTFCRMCCRQDAGRVCRATLFMGNNWHNRYRRVTAADVKRVANQYLVANHLVMSYIPAKTPPPPAKTDKPASTESKKKDAALIAKQDAMLPKLGTDPKFSLPAIEKSTL